MILGNKLSALLKGLFDSREELAQNRKNILTEQLFAGTANALVSNNYLTGLLIRLQMSDTAIGNISVLTYLTGALQAVSYRALNRFRYKKPVVIWGKTAAYLINIVLIGCIPFVGLGKTAAAAWVFLLVLLCTGISALINPGMAVWHIRSIPPAVRNDYFSVFTVVSNTVTFVVIFLSGRIADIFKSAGKEVLGLTVLRMIAVPCALLDVVWLCKIREYPEKTASGDPAAGMLKKTLRDPVYRPTLLAGVLWSFSANIIGPYYNIYLLKDMHVSYTVMALVNLGFILSLFLFTPVWSRFIRRTSFFHAMRVLMSCFLLHYVVLSMVTRRSVFLYPLGALYSYIFLAGLNAINAGMPYHGMPEDQRIGYIGCYSTLTSVAALCGLEAGTLFVTFSSHLRIKAGGMVWGNIQLLMVVSAVIMGGCAAWVKRLEKNDETEKERV